MFRQDLHENRKYYYVSPRCAGLTKKKKAVISKKESKNWCWMIIDKQFFDTINTTV